MDDYIKRQAALDAVQDILNDPNCPLFIAATIEQILTDLPAYNVHENVPVEWKKEVIIKPFLHIVYKCIKCGYISDKSSNFCSNCGARMVKK